MALVVAIVLAVFTVVLRLAGPDKVNGGPFGGLQLLPEFGAPADDFGDTVTEGHVSKSDIGGLRADRCSERREG